MMAEGSSVRVLRLACLLVLAAPSTAHAADLSIVSRDLPVGGRALAGVQAQRPFELVGVHWQGSGRVLFRTRRVAGRWSLWRTAAPEAEDLPDAGSAEGASARGWRIGNPYWVGPSDRIQWRTIGVVRRLRAWFVHSGYATVPLRQVSVAGSPPILPRAAWNADERILRGPPQYAPFLRLAIVHHTAGSNAYTPAQSPAIVRAIELYHVKANGWKDIGYNFLVDRYGQVFEGRYGGMQRNVVGAHAEGFNTGSVGIAVIGNYSATSLPKAAEDALARLIAWRLDVAHVEPLSSVTWVSYGNPRFRVGVPVLLRAVSGHRDTGFTACPGAGIYARLAAIAAEAERIGRPKLYDPAARGRIGGLVRFSGRLSTALPWTVSVTSGGALVARGSGSGTNVAWTWNAAGRRPGRYVWTIEAGPSVRPASGVIGGSQAGPPPPPPPPLVRGLGVFPRALSPNGDGYSDTGTAGYTLTTAATVTATVLDTSGTVVATIAQDVAQPAGRNTLLLDPGSLSDGAYTLILVARTADGRSGTARAAFVVDRVLGSVAALPAVFTPNGDGVDDTITFSFELAGTALVTVEVRQAGGLVAMVFQGTLGPGPYSVAWDGHSGNELAEPGTYQVVVRAADDLGESAQSATFDLAPG